MKKLLTTTIILCFFQLSTYAQDYWEFVHRNDTVHIYSMIIAQDGTIYYGAKGGLFISHDDGVSWECKHILFYLAIYAMEFDLDSNLIVGASNRLFRYKVEEDEWELLMQGEHTYGFVTIYIDSTVFLAGNVVDLYKFEDSVWVEIDVHPSYVGATDIVKDQDGRLFIGATNFTGGGGVIQSLDNGETWTLIGLYNSYVSSLAIDSYNRLYAGSSGHQLYSTGGLYRYNREIDAWDTVRLYHRVMSMLINNEDSLYIGQYTTGGPPNGVFISHDYGETWSGISSGLPEDGSYKNIMELYLGPQNRLYAIVQDTNSIFRSIHPTIVGTDENNIRQSFNVRAFPNPFSSRLIVSMEQTGHGHCKYSIYSLGGRIVEHKENVHFSNGEFIIRTNESLPKGVYLLTIEFNNKTITKRIIKY